MGTLLLIRHGAVGGDAAARFLGASDWAMSEAGEAQIAALARRLAAHYRLDAVYCSDLARSRQSAEVLAVAHAAPIRIRAALREIDLGEWDGRLRSEIAERHGEAYAQRGRDIAGFRPPGGESFRDLAGRVLPCWREVVAGHADGVAAVVAHAGVNRVILCDALGAPLENLFRLAQPPACLNVVEIGRGAPVVRLLGAGEP